MPWYENAGTIVSIASACVSLASLGWNILLARRTSRKARLQARRDFQSSEFTSEVRAPFNTILSELETVVAGLRAELRAPSIDSAAVSSWVRERQRDRIAPMFDRLLSAAARADRHPSLPPLGLGDAVSGHQDGIFDALNGVYQAQNDSSAVVDAVRRTCEAMEEMDRDLKARLSEALGRLVGFGGG